MLAVTPVVDMSIATHNIFVAEKALWRHNIPRSKSWKIRCNFDDVNDAETRGTITDCTFRVYLNRDYTKRVLLLKLNATTVIRSQAHGLDKQGLGRVWYSQRRQIQLTKYTEGG
jgi:hypothetical protein